MTVTPAPAQTENLTPDLKMMANAIRALAMDAVQKANSGHPGMPMGMADVATVLFSKFMKFNPQDGHWPDRDRFILSAGHGSMLMYALAFLTGYPKMTMAEIQNFRQLHSLTPGHPEIMHEVGIETTTGPLGQGISSAVGFALAERILAKNFGDALVDHYTYVIAGDGDMMEGISHEACSLAGHMGLHKLIVLYDDNGISIDGPTDLSFSDDTTKRFEAYGWDTQTIDGHDFAAIENALEKARKSKKPSLISCKTKIGFGAPTKENSSSSHGSPLGEEEIAGARKNLGWDYPPFEIPEDVLENWRAIGRQADNLYKEWMTRFSASSSREEFEKWHHYGYDDALRTSITELKASFAKDLKKLATRQASGLVLDHLIDVIPNLIGGSADLTGSNNTYKKGTQIISKESGYEGRYIHYGVREHGMAAIMNGMAQHGGLIPYSGTFLTFSDYSRPSIRLAALMKTQAIHVLTHDSIGLGEDGPTHQSVEHLTALRAIPNCFVFRPCDTIETAECWEIALRMKDAPSCMALTRQGLPPMRHGIVPENLSLKGAYILADNATNTDPDLILMASGSEVHLAMQAYEALIEQGKNVRVISVPCLDLFKQQDKTYHDSLLKSEKARKIVIEAGVRQSWDYFMGENDVFIGMEGFGESAPADALFKHFGITKDAILKAAE